MDVIKQEFTAFTKALEVKGTLNLREIKETCRIMRDTNKKNGKLQIKA